MAFQNWFKPKASSTLNRAINILLILIILIISVQRLPLWWSQRQMEDRPIEQIETQLLNGELFRFEPGHGPLVMVFWATWCGPCTVELERIAKLVKAGVIPKEQMLAVVSNEEPQLVSKVVRDRAYPFLIGNDVTGLLGARFKVVATPTVVLISRQGIVDWVATGISPSLEWRIKRLFATHDGNGS